MSLVLTARDVDAVITMDIALDAVEKAFLAYGLGRVNMPPKSYLIVDRGDFRAMYGRMELDGAQVCGLKWVNVHPKNSTHDLPSVMAKIVLNDFHTGLELADLDGTLITNMRTGASGGVAARYLAKNDAATLGLIGAGVQAWFQFLALRLVRPIREVFLGSSD